MTAPARSILRTSCVSLLAAAAVFLLLEASARLYLFGLAGLSPTRVNSVRGLPQSGFTQPSAEPRLGFALRPNLAGFFKLVPFRTNAAGQRDRDYALAKPPGVFRVAVVGSSFALPAGVAIEDAFHSRLEARCAPRCEFINFAVGMYNPEQVLAMLELRALAWAPDLVLMTATRLSLPWLADDPRSAEGRARRRPDLAALPRFGRSYPVLRSFLWQLVAARVAGAPAPGTESLGWLERAALALTPRVEPSPALAPAPLPELPEGSVIERLARLARERGLPVALVLLEFEDRPPGPLEAEVAAAAAAAGVPYLDTRDAFRGTRASDYWIYQLDP